MVLTATTGKGPKGKGSEIERVVPITREPDRQRRVVMSLGPGDGGLPKLEPGDHLSVTAELELTTDCRNWAQGDCVHQPYEYAPIISVRLLLCDSAKTTGASGGLSVQLADPRQEPCTHGQHHKLFVFTGAELLVPPQGLSWLQGDAHINVVVDAHHHDAGADHVILVGENDPGDPGPGGVVKGDKGRINAVRRQPDCPKGESMGTQRLLDHEIGIETGDKVVVCSQEVGKLKRNDQLLVNARLETSVAHLDYPVRVSTRVLLADGPGKTEAEGEAARVGPFGGEISEHNGTNSDGDATARKVGVLRARHKSKQSLFVNLVADAGNPRGDATGDSVKVRDGFLEVERFGADLCG